MLVIPFLPKISFGSCTNSSNLNHSPAAVRACCDASWHLWVWRGSIPFTLQSYSQQGSGDGGAMPAPPQQHEPPCPRGCAWEELMLRCWAHPMVGNEHSWEFWPGVSSAPAMGKLVLMAPLAPSSFLTQGWRVCMGCRGWTVGQTPQYP